MLNKEDVKSGKYLTFLLGQEDYGIPIQTVREIIGMLHITNIPKTPEYINGVVNLRGKIIPIMDLRLKFGLEKKEYTERTCIIVVEIKAETGRRNIGIVVDTVSEVLNISATEIELSPQDDVQNDGEFITGMGKVKDKVVMLLDVEKVLNKEEFRYIKEMKEAV